ncbi:hypothetical protein ACFJGW_19975 [Burkholderiaceae bacterium UC74_6]
MNRYLRMGTRRSGASHPKPHHLDDGDVPLAREDSAAIDTVYDGIKSELDVRDGLLDEEDSEAGGATSTAAPPALMSRAWCGERGAYVAVRAPKAPITGRR